MLPIMGAAFVINITKRIQDKGNRRKLNRIVKTACAGPTETVKSCLADVLSYTSSPLTFSLNMRKRAVLSDYVNPDVVQRSASAIIRS